MRTMPLQCKSYAVAWEEVDLTAEGSEIAKTRWSFDILALCSLRTRVRNLRTRVRNLR